MSEGKCARKQRGKENRGGKGRARGKGRQSFPIVSSRFQDRCMRAWIEQPSSSAWMWGKMAPQNQKVSPVSEKLPARNGVTCKLIEESSAVCRVVPRHPSSQEDPALCLPLASGG